MVDDSYEMGMVGLGVMGRNLALNMVDKGFSVAGYDVDGQKADALERESGGHGALGTRSAKELVSALRKPRAIMMMVPAGAPVDAAIAGLLPYLEGGDILIDGGNSHFIETDARSRTLGEKGILYLGVGISGGERGARLGPSIMPGGSEEGYAHVRPIFEAIAASVDGEACAAYMGPGSAGHYVQMVHNGIEYGIMQLIAESYHIMKIGLALSNEKLGEVYASWSTSSLKGYLMEITARIFSRKDEETGRFLIDLILDEAKEKGTGKWAAQDAMELRVPLPTIDMAVFMRDLSDQREERRKTHEVIPGPGHRLDEEAKQFVDILREALRVSFVATYAQGMAQLRSASHAYGYGWRLDEVARIWRGGCIIRSDMLEPIRQAFHEEPDLAGLLLHPTFAGIVTKGQADLRRVVAAASGHAIPVAALASSLAYVDGYCSAWLPANLVQAQRDYFGSHMYRRIDRDGLFHTQWEG
jgi:6-phosphogluconate dehydrogenase